MLTKHRQAFLLCRALGAAEELEQQECAREKEEEDGLMLSFRAAPLKAALNLPPKALSTLSWKCLVHLLTESIFAELTVPGCLQMISFALPTWSRLAKGANT